MDEYASPSQLIVNGQCDDVVWNAPAVRPARVDIPSAVTPAEAATLDALAAGQIVLEVGALLGHSTVVLARSAKHVISIDPHEGYPAHDPRPTLGPFLSNLERWAVRDKVTVMLGTDADVLPYLQVRSFGLAFIDCTGEYQVTLDALRRCVPLLRHHAAMAVHDCGHPDWPGALEAAETFALEQGRTFELVDRMAVFTGTWGA
jgi:predicted O-methyltransferase YrrM